MTTYIQKVKAAKEHIKTALNTYNKICAASSGGKDSIVLLHLIKESIEEMSDYKLTDLPVIIVFMDTEFPETVEFMRNVADEWQLRYEEYEAIQGKDVNIEDCCGKPKVEKFKDVLEVYDAWFSGIRSTEGVTRANFKLVEEKDGLVKINPLLDFTERDVWKYTAVNQLPVNPKYKDGYRSLGCAICTVPETDENESERAGRWKGTNKEGGECGVHSESLRRKQK